VTAYKLSACTAQHIGDRQEQQDRLTLIKHPRLKSYAMAVVADGMGGRTGGGVAAEQAVNTCTQLFNSFQELENVPELLMNCVLEAHAVIKLLSISEEKEPHSTMVTLLATPSAVHWVHVGDSRLYLFRNHALKEVTIDHSYTTDAVAAGLLTLEQAAVHPNRNMLTSALGMTTTPRYTLGELLDPLPGDTFLIASDGLWGYFAIEELEQVLTTMTGKVACEFLIEIARQRAQGRGDNLSIVVLNLIAEEASA
jgi:serine/threonine protein phosphatase PrpC